MSQDETPSNKYMLTQTHPKRPKWMGAGWFVSEGEHEASQSPEDPKSGATSLVGFFSLRNQSRCLGSWFIKRTDHQFEARAAPTKARLTTKAIGWDANNRKKKLKLMSNAEPVPEVGLLGLMDVEMTGMIDRTTSC